MRQRLVALALAAASAAVLAACSAGPQAATSSLGDTANMADIERLARQEGQVVWYTGSLPATSKAVIERFRQRYGIEVVMPGRMSSTEMGTRIQTDVRNTGAAAADVIGPTPDEELFHYMRDEDVSIALQQGTYQGISAEYYLDDAAVTCQIQIPVVGYNTAVLGDFRPSSWKDLLDPRVRDQIMVADPRSSIVWLRVWSVLMHDPALGQGYIDGLVAQNLRPVGNSIIAAEQLVAGQGAVQIAGIPNLFEPAKAAGKPIDFWVPKDPALISPNYCGLAARSAHPNAGWLFQQWLLTQEGQQILNGTERSASPLGEVPEGFPLPVNAVFPKDQEQLRAELPQLASTLGFN